MPAGRVLKITVAVANERYSDAFGGISEPLRGRMAVYFRGLRPKLANFGPVLIFAARIPTEESFRHG